MMMTMITMRMITMRMITTMLTMMIMIVIILAKNVIIDKTIELNFKKIKKIEIKFYL